MVTEFHMVGWHAWQQRLSKCLESRHIHNVFLILLIVDFACVVAELAIVLVSKNSCERDSVHHDVLPVVHTLEWISMSIVSIFLLELITKLLCFGWKYFARSWLHVFDACVILLTFVLMVTLFGSKAENVAALLIFFRVFYIFRVIDSVATTTAVQYERTIRRLENEVERYRRSQVPPDIQHSTFFNSPM
jgi:hypothetical protein